MASFEKLRNACQRAQGLKEKPTTENVADYFLSAGIELKGQSQCCYQDKGYSIRLGASFDPLSLHTAGVFSSEISVSAEVSASDKKLIILQVGPVDIDGYSIDEPLILNFCQGRKYSGSLGAALFAGISFGNNKVASVSAGAHASGNLSGDYFYAENRKPLSFGLQQRSTVLNTLKKLLDEADIKSLLKIPAIEFLNQHRNKMGATASTLTLKKTGLSSFWSANQSTETLVGLLDDVIASEPKPTSKKEAIFIKKALEDYKTGMRPSITSNVRISSATAVANAKFTGDANIRADMGGGLSIDIKSCNTLANTNAKCKNVYIRFQSSYPAKLKQTPEKKESAPSFLVAMTQDTKLIYTQWGFQLAKTENSSNVTKKEGLTLNRETELLGENVINYVTTTVYWASQEKINGYYAAPQRKQTSSIKSISTKSLQGSGISFGCAVSVEKLNEIFEDENSIYIDNINKALDEYDYWFDEAYKKSSFNLVKHVKPEAYNGLRYIIKDDISCLPEAVAWLLDDQDRATRPNISKFKNRLDKNTFRTNIWQSPTKKKLIELLQSGYDKSLEDLAVGSNNPNGRGNYLSQLASQLKVNSADLDSFFIEGPLRGLVADLKELYPNLGAIILESGFEMSQADIKLSNRVVAVPGTTRGFVRIKETFMNELTELDIETSKNMFKSFKENPPPLNVIRMRFRMQDTYSDGGELFKLGLKALGNGGEIKLKSVDEAGSEGIIDLHTKWYNTGQSVDEEENYKKGVPAVALYCQ